MVDARIKFLVNLYSLQCKVGNYFILSAKQDKKWADVPFKWVSVRKAKKDLTRFFKEYPQEDYDLYFSTVVYQSNRRRKADAIASKFLWQDIDEKEDINELLDSKFKPTYIWESSPNKYQGLWEFDRYLEVEDMERINPYISEYFGCDKCHDVGHVLRIPGTINHKYRNNPKVGKATHTKCIHRPSKFKVKSKPKQDVVETKGGDLTKEASEILKRYNLDKYTLDSLVTLKDDRSGGIWQSVGLLMESGMTDNEIATVVMCTPNYIKKYSNRKNSNILQQIAKMRREKPTGDISQALDLANEDNKEEVKSTFVIDDFDTIMGAQDMSHGWLVEGFWGRRSHGIVAGQPKVFKSTFVQDLSVSVASGKPFLGRYKVHDPGPVLIIQNENTASMIKDRNEKMMAHKGLVGKVVKLNRRNLRVRYPQSLPIYYINQRGFTFDDEEQKKIIEDTVKEIKPVLVIFDPLYLMFGGDINSAKELQGVLKWLLDMKNNCGTAIMLVHHYNKGTGESRGGQKMLGSVTLHGWVESAWYMRRNIEKEKEREVIDANAQIDEPSYIILEREFRQMGSYPEVELSIKLGDYGTPDYEVSAEIYDPEGKTQSIDKSSLVRDILYNKLKNSSVPLTRTMWVEMCSPEELMGVPQKKIKILIDDLVNDGYVINRGQLGYTVNDKVSYTYKG